MTDAAARLSSLTDRMRAHGYVGVAARPSPASVPLATWFDDTAAVRGAVAAHGRLRGFTDATYDEPVAAGLLGKSLLGGPISTMIAGWTLDRWVPDLTPANLTIEPGVDGAVVCAPVTVRTLRGSPDVDALVAAVDELAAHCVDGICRSVRVGRRLLWGNVALQTRTPFQVLFGIVGERADRDYERLAASYARVRPLLADIDAVDALGRPFRVARRRTCCLLYQGARQGVLLDLQPHAGGRRRRRAGRAGPRPARRLSAAPGAVLRRGWRAPR